MDLSWAKCRKSYWCRLIAESILPIAAGVSWAFLATQVNTAKFQIVSAFGIGFFFILALQGQFLRIEKNVRDEKRGDSIEGRLEALEQSQERRFDTMEQGLAALRDRGLATERPPPAEPPHPPLQQPTEQVEALLERVNRPAVFSEEQIEAAKAALEMGLWYPAVLMAAVAFDRAISEVAGRLDIPYPMNAQRVFTILSKSDFLTLEQIETLQTLRRFRNSIVHSRAKEEIHSYEEAREIVEAFEVGVKMLKEIPKYPTLTF